jgi:hypothetical protein
MTGQGYKSPVIENSKIRTPKGGCLARNVHGYNARQYSFQGIRVLADDEAPDPPLTPHQRKLVKALTPAQIRAIDLALLANISPHWRNVARVVAATMLDVENRAGGIPDVFYAERVKVLVERGTIEAQGDMSRMRLLEVRFAMRSAAPNPLKPGAVIDLSNLDASNVVTKSADVEFIDVFSADVSTEEGSSAIVSAADANSGGTEPVTVGENLEASAAVDASTTDADAHAEKGIPPDTADVSVTAPAGLSTPAAESAVADSSLLTVPEAEPKEGVVTGTGSADAQLSDAGGVNTTASEATATDASGVNVAGAAVVPTDISSADLTNSPSNVEPVHTG